MGRMYQAFLKKQISLLPLGIEKSDDRPLYFCTPRGASVIGWAGADGIHYCFIRGFGEMVFAVSPMNPAPDYVHPLAENFTDFLRLLLACGDAGLLEQAWMWDKEKFETFLEENTVTAEQEKTLGRIAGEMKLAPMERPWEYIKALQTSFDYSKIKYTEDFCDPDMNPACLRDADPESARWNVFFEGTFWGHHGKDRAGKEIPLGKQFVWADRQWEIPAIYVCGKGLVMDFCMRVEAEKIRAFMQKWNLNGENDSCENIAEEQQMEMERENPLAFAFTPSLKWNGRDVRASHGCAVGFNPCRPEGTVCEPEAEQAVCHYGLDRACGWVIFRHSFAWEGRRRPKIRTLLLTLKQHPVSVPGPRFTAMTPGDTVSFFAPTDGKEHTLTVLEMDRQVIPKECFGSDEWEFPPHCCMVRYTVTPEMEGGSLRITDTSESDRPKEKSRSVHGSAAAVGAATVFIGGADGPAAVVFGGQKAGKTDTACSSLHFSPAEEIEWRIVFQKRQYDSFEITLF